MPPISCIVDFCPSKSGTEVTLHKFPRDAAQRQAWIDFVRAAGRHYWTPSKYSVICSLHFDSSSYECNPAYLAGFGIRAKRFLRPGAVPTLYPAEVQRLLAAESSQSGPPAPKRQCVVGARGLPDSCEDAGIDETPDFSSSSTALTHGQAAPLRHATQDAESQTDFTVADIMLQEDTAPRCSSPNWDDLSATFEDNPHDSTYQPSLDTSAVSSSEPSPPLKFIVYENCLLQFANLYRKWHHPAQSSLKVIGSLVGVTITCPNMHSTKWYSQPTQKRIGHGNVLLAAAILFAGCSPTQSLRLLENAGICCFSKRTYDRIQKDTLFPAVYKVCMFNL
ncbi:hypothetical protein V5799_003901 [Amblyomma americanum]|uniref:THAP-type domain-containing protein n=1 Tax=Amblyomma americanum TaxID=6943 RepID=A0AAQ4D7M6_AMBAM